MTYFPSGTPSRKYDLISVLSHHEACAWRFGIRASNVSDESLKAEKERVVVYRRHIVNLWGQTQHRVLERVHDHHHLGVVRS